jgi:thioesterase domain-containing protein
MHRALLAEIKRSSKGAPQSLRFIRSGGAPLPASLREELSTVLRVPVLDVYGLSETGGITSTTLDEFTPAGSVGRSIGPDIAILGQNGILMAGEQAIEEPGEILVRGPAIMTGYLSPESANEAAFHDGWFRTGDIGRIDRDGFLYLAGRAKEIINRGGEKIRPEEIDNALAQHPSVQEVAAFAVVHPTLGEDVACAVVLRKGLTATVAELRAFARQQLAPFKVPRLIFFRDSIPRGSTGKAKRLSLRAEYESVTSLQTPAQAAVTPSAPPSSRKGQLNERDHLRQLWCELLGCGQIDDQADFFHLGGDSLLAITMLARLDDLFGFVVPLSAERFIENATIDGLMEMLAQADIPGTCNETGSIVYPLHVGGQAGTIFLLPVNDTKGLYLRRLARRLPNRWSTSLIRPAERGPFRPLHAIEDAAQEAVRAIRETQPAEPYILAGYCQGGVIAFEAALRLERTGARVYLVLFDTPFPGGVDPVTQWPVYGKNAKQKLREAKRDLTPMPLLRSARSMTRRATWLMLRRLRPAVDKLWHLSSMRGICTWATNGNFTFYRAERGAMPILHFFAQTQTSVMLAESRVRWECVTRGPVTIHSVQGNHLSLFDEEHLPELSRAMDEWLSKQLKGDVSVR